MVLKPPAKEKHERRARACLVGGGSTSDKLVLVRGRRTLLVRTHYITLPHKKFVPNFYIENLIGNKDESPGEMNMQKPTPDISIYKSYE